MSSQESTSSRFMRGAGDVQEPRGAMWAPMRWVISMIQYLIAIIMVTIAEGFKAIVSGKKPSGKRSSSRPATARTKST